MEEKKFTCKICKRDFASEEALGHHNSAKYSENKSNITEKKPINTKKIRNKMIIILVLVGITALIGAVVLSTMKEGESCQNQPATEINIGGHTNLALHIHQDLEIVIDGITQEIPSEIGIYPGIMRPLHTHDSTGELHVEGPCERDFVLGDFFDIWGKEFNSNQIFDKTTENGKLKMFVNEVESLEFDNLILKDDQVIKIEYTSNS